MKQIEVGDKVELKNGCVYDVCEIVENSGAGCYNGFRMDRFGARYDKPFITEEVVRVISKEAE